MKGQWSIVLLLVGVVSCGADEQAEPLDRDEVIDAYCTIDSQCPAYADFESKSECVEEMTSLYENDLAPSDPDYGEDFREDCQELLLADLNCLANVETCEEYGAWGEDAPCNDENIEYAHNCWGAS